MSKVAKATLWIMFATMFSKLLGFFREIVLANFYGTGGYADVFLLTLNIPGTIIAVVGSAIATTYVPLYFKTKEKHGEEGSLKFTNNMFNIIVVISLVVSIVSLMFTEELVNIFAGGFTGDKFDLAVTFTKIMMCGVVFLGTTRLISSYLQVNDNFAIPGLIGVPYNIIIIIAIAVSTKTSITVLAYGSLLAMASQLLFQLPSAIKRSYKYKPYLNIKDDNIKEMVILMAPMLVGVAIGQINIFVDRALATGLGDGKVAALNYAGKLNDFVMALFVASIVTVIYPKLSKLSNLDEKEGFIDTFVKSSNFITLLVLPITAGAIILAEPIVRILFERGQFTTESTIMTSTVLKVYVLGLLASGLRDVLCRVFYSLSDTKTPMINGSIALVINIVLNFTLINYLGYVGLALSTSIASIITVVLLFVSLRKKTGYFGGDKILKTGLKSLIATIAMGAVAGFTYNNLYAMLGASKLHEIIAVGVAVVLGAIVYGVLVTLMKVDEVKIIFNLINQAKNKILKR